jgi:hypothetical protein
MQGAFQGLFQKFFFIVVKTGSLGDVEPHSWPIDVIGPRLVAVYQFRYWSDLVQHGRSGLLGLGAGDCRVMFG